MSVKLSRYKHRLFIVLVAILLAEIPFTIFSYQAAVSFHNNRQTFDDITLLFADVELEARDLLVRVELDCVEPTMRCDQHLERLLVLSNSNKITQIRSLSGNQGEWLTKRHEEQIERVVIALRGVASEPTAANKHQAIEAMGQLHTIYQDIKRNLDEYGRTLDSRYFISSIALVMSALIAFLLYVVTVRIQMRREQKSANQRWKQVQDVSQTLGRSQLHEELQQNSQYDPAVQSIVERFIATRHDLETAVEDIQLFRNINKSINYEFRSLTSTITGGLRLLSGEMEGKSVVLANEMIQSTEVLDELANNFLGIFGGSASETETDLSYVIDKVMSLVRTKTERNRQQLECYVTRYVPTALQVSPIKLLWSIYLELSKAIEIYRSSDVTIVIDANRELGSEKRRLSIKFFFTDIPVQSIEELIQSDWKEYEIAAQCFADLIFAGNVPCQLSTSSDSSGRICYSLELVARPANIVHEATPLKDTNFLVCGSSGLQNDIITKTIEIAGGKVTTLEKPSEIFRTIPTADRFQAIIVTDTIKGLDFGSFLKTLRSRMAAAKLNTKLILSLASQKFDLSSTQYVDRVLLRPTSPSAFISGISSVIDSDDSSDNTTNNRIICIDDDVTHGFILTEILSTIGWDATHFESPREAIEYIKENNIHIVFMDCVMPEIDGFEATRLIREFESEQQTLQGSTIIGATGLTSISEMNACVEAGMDYVINKPYSQEEIARVLKTYTAARKVS